MTAERTTQAELSDADIEALMNKTTSTLELCRLVIAADRRLAAEQEWSSEADCRPTCTICVGENGERWPCAKERGAQRRLAAEAAPALRKAAARVLAFFDDYIKDDGYESAMVRELRAALATPPTEAT